MALCYVCKVPDVQGDNSLACPAGSIAGYRDDECFRLVTQPRSWADAEEDCFFSYGGELLSVHDERTNDLLSVVIPNDNNPVTSFWLGATRRSNSPFFWWDGSAFDFTRLSPDGKQQVTITPLNEWAIKGNVPLQVIATRPSVLYPSVREDGQSMMRLTHTSSGTFAR